MTYNSKQNKSKTMCPIIDSTQYILIQNTQTHIFNKLKNKKKKFQYYNYILIQHLLLFNAQWQHASFQKNHETDKQKNPMVAWCEKQNNVPNYWFKLLQIDSKQNKSKTTKC